MKIESRTDQRVMFMADVLFWRNFICASVCEEKKKKRLVDDQVFLIGSFLLSVCGEIRDAWHVINISE